MQITESFEKDVTYSEFIELRCSVGWNSSLSENIFNQFISKSDLFYSLRDIDENNKLIGFGRILNDGYNCMIYDVIVNPEYQGNKLGKQIVNNLITYAKNNGYRNTRLYYDPDNKEYLVKFYTSLGFKPMDIAMELKLK